MKGTSCTSIHLFNSTQGKSVYLRLLCIMGGMFVVMELYAGHFSAGFTLDTYAHVTTAAQKEAASTMGNVLAGTAQNG